MHINKGKTGDDTNEGLILLKVYYYCETYEIK